MSFDVRTRLSLLKSSAKQRHINVNLDINKYQYVIDAGCYFCGSDLSNENGYCLDRVDNNKGYTIENVVGCCKICNRAKSNMKVNDFVEWLQTASKHIEKQLDSVNRLKELGITEEMYVKLCTEITNNVIKDKSKERMKVVNT